MKIGWGITFFFLAGTVYAQDVRVVEVKGSAEMRSAIDQEWTPLKSGDEISDGAWIQTAFKSRVYIKFWTNTVVQIKSASLVQVKGLSNDGKRMAGRLHLALGAARIRVKPDREEIVDFKVATTRMTVSIKGTVVQVSKEGCEVVVVQVEGTVAVSSPNSSSLTLEPGDQLKGSSMSGEPEEELTALHGRKFKDETACLGAALTCVIRCSRMESKYLADEWANQVTSGDGGSSSDNTPPIP